MYYIMEMDDYDPTMEADENMPSTKKPRVPHSLLKGSSSSSSDPDEGGPSTATDTSITANNTNSSIDSMTASTTTNNNLQVVEQEKSHSESSLNSNANTSSIDDQQSDFQIPKNQTTTTTKTQQTSSLLSSPLLSAPHSPSSSPSPLKELISPITQFYSTRTNYDCMPNSGKVIVFDIDLPVKEAFDVAAQNDLSFATLWDSQKGALVGMITVTDLIEILLHFHNRTSVIKELIAEHEIRQMRELGHRNRPEKLVHVTPEDTLLTSIRVLHKNKIHRLPVVSTKGNLLQIITHSHLLAFMVHNISFNAPIFQKSIEELGIGTYANVTMAYPHEKVFNVLSMFKKHKISAVPIVDKDGAIIDVFSRYDVVYLIRMDEDQYCLDMTVGEALKSKPKIPVFTCMKTESLGKVLRHLATTRIHRLVCVDENSIVTGVNHNLQGNFCKVMSQEGRVLHVSIYQGSIRKGSKTEKKKILEIDSLIEKFFSNHRELIRNSNDDPHIKPIGRYLVVFVSTVMPQGGKNFTFLAVCTSDLRYRIAKKLVLKMKDQFMKEKPTSDQDIMRMLTDIVTLFKDHSRVDLITECQDLMNKRREEVHSLLDKALLRGELINQNVQKSERVSNLSSQLRSGSSEVRKKTIGANAVIILICIVAIVLAILVIIGVISFNLIPMLK